MPEDAAIARALDISHVIGDALGHGPHASCWVAAARWLRTWPGRRQPVDPAHVAATLEELRTGHYVTCHPVVVAIWLAHDPPGVRLDDIAYGPQTDMSEGLRIITGPGHVATRPGARAIDYIEYARTSPGDPLTRTHVPLTPMTPAAQIAYAGLREHGMPAALAARTARDATAPPPARRAGAMSR